jgi:VCBS repeat-containing protein
MIWDAIASLLRPRQLRPVARRAILRGEELESRCVPTIYRWNVSTWSNTSNWNDSDDWEFKVGDGWFPAPNGTYPGKADTDDDVEFWAPDNSEDFTGDCFLNITVSLHSLTMKPGSFSKLMLQSGKNLTISGSNALSELRMDGNGAIYGDPDIGEAGSVVVKPKASFTWRSGYLTFLNVDIQRAQNNEATMVIAPKAAGTPSLTSTVINVHGQLQWGNVDVICATPRGDKQSDAIHIYQDGVFNITAAGKQFNALNGADADPNRLTVQNEGTVILNSAGTATLVANYETSGTTELTRGTLAISGTAEQNNPLSGSSSFKIFKGSTIATPFLGIRDGAIIGNGTVTGSLILGRDPGSPNYSFSLPTIAPGGGGGNIGTIVVTNDFHMYNGRMEIEIASPPDPAPGSPQPFDRVQVGGYASFATTDFASVRKVEGILLAVHQGINATTNIPFLSYSSRTDDFSTVVKPGSNWSWDKNNTSYWFRLPTPNPNISPSQGRIGGRVFRDDGAVAGAFESGTEDPLVGVTVKLRDATGTTVLATTTTDSEGLYEFDDLDPGVYVVEFVRPTGERLTLANATDDAADSDADPLTGWAVVDVNNAFAESVFAGFNADADPEAANDSFDAHKNTAIAGTVLTNDTDSDDDALTVALDTDVSHGTLTLNSDGTFTYTPNTNYTGTDSFTYTVDDGYDGTDTATVTITIANTAAPVGANDTYTTPAGLVVEVAEGVLDNDTDQNNGTLVAVLTAGPSHGTLELNSDGSFVYTPDEDYVGTDSFTYRPSDADGPGNLATVTISVTDHAPEAVDDTASTNEDTAVAIGVLDNDADADNDALTILGVSDGIYGTVAIDDNGTANDPTDDFVVYTPDANFNGTDWFVYVIDDGYGRLSYATATVTVSAVNDAPDAVNDAYGTLQNQQLPMLVRLNDTDIDGDTLTVTGVGLASHGTVTYTSTSVTYTPFGGYTGTDSFTYTISDGHGGTDTATVNMIIAAPATISGNLWLDLDHDGINDFPMEPPNSSGVQVQLLDSAGNVLATTTASNGQYAFNNLFAGNYQVRVILPPNVTVSPKDQGSNDAIDSDFNSTGYSDLLSLSAGITLDLDIGWY